MRIQSLTLHNFKKFSDSVFHFHPQFTVLIGDNATGKTSVLDGLATLMGTYLLRSRIPTGRSGLKPEEIRIVANERELQVFIEPQKPAFVEGIGLFKGEQLQWRRDYGDKGGLAKEMVNLGNDDFLTVSQGADIDLPVLLYYGAGRLWTKHNQVEVGKPDSRLVGYRNCLDPKSDQYLFQQWFKQLTLSSLQKGVEIPALAAVRETVKACIPGADYFYHDISNDKIMVRFKDAGTVPFNNLSDGYRNMVSMVADIAHRISRLNPHLGLRVARETQGIVLIDEIDLHLHPNWQRRVVQDLRAIYPKIQFIVTTHSPFIIQALGPGELIDLNHIEDESPQPLDLGLAMPSPKQPFSNRPIEDIAETVMGVPIPQRGARYQRMYEVAQEYYQLLKASDIADADKRDALEARLDELTAPFSDDVAYHAFLEMERLHAGLQPSRKPR